MTSSNTQFAVAVHALILIRELPEQMHSSARLAASANSNPVHLRRVLGQLRQAGLVASRPGPRGGWRLLRPPNEISLADVWSATNGAEPVLGLHDASPNCAQGERIHRSLEALDREVLDALTTKLAQTTLADFSGLDPEAQPAAPLIASRDRR